jgi:tRNA 2-thiouridine synthesizing protein A
MSELETLDARGLLCPLPVIRTQDRIKGLDPGTVLEVLATDAGTIHDIPAWCRVHGHELLSVDEVDLDEEDAKDTGAKSSSIRGGHEIRIRLKVC